jgi:hypothetical protein
LSQLDKPAEDNTWHDVPDMSRGNISAQFKSTYNQNKPFGKKELEEAAGNASQTAHPSGERDPTSVANAAARDQQYGTNSGVDAQGGVRAGLDTLKQATRENVDGDVQQNVEETARNYKARTNDYLKSKMPEERREQTIWRLKKMVVEIQGHQDCKFTLIVIFWGYANGLDQRAIDTLLRLAEEYTGHGKNVAQQSQGAVKGAHTDDSLKLAEADLKVRI